MADTSSFNIKQRLQRLEAHLAQEHPVLLNVVKSFRVLDAVAYRTGLLDRSESYATRVPWWPLISVLGTFSSGKSTFINDYLGYRLQLTGNQAVDDKFTVVCYSSDHAPRVLPGLALDADPRFPFYNISNEIEAVATGEGRRVDAYLQLKTCPSEKLRGKILIDSPGFDADFQRTSTLRITKHIIDLSDLVLVFFDARHPEPGAMKDTLQHLVVDTIMRPDSSKFLYILNQIDTTAREDNPEEVFAAWQRALGGTGLTAGRFYRIYNLEAAIPIEDESLRRRFEVKRAVDVAEILGRMQQVEVDRAYRIIGVLEKTAKSIENEFMPRLSAAKRKWKRRVLLIDAVVYALVVGCVLAWSFSAHWWDGPEFAPTWIQWATGPGQPPWHGLFVAGAAAAFIYYLHFAVRKLAAGTVSSGLRRDPATADIRDSLVHAFHKNTRPLRSVFRTAPVGWGRRARKELARVLGDADRYVQALNDRFTNPSGQTGSTRAQPAAATDIPSDDRPEAILGVKSETEGQDAKVQGLTANR